MAVTFLESGTDATQDLSFWAVTGGSTITSDTTFSNTGPRSIKVSSASDGSSAQIASPVGVLTDAGSRFSFRVRFHDFGTSSDLQFAGPTDSGGLSYVFYLNVSTAGVLSVQGASGAVTGSTLSLSTWYRLSVGYTIVASNNFTINVFLNGVLNIAATQANMTFTNGTGSSRFSVQWTPGANGNSTYFNVDDVYCDSGTSNDDPGNISVTSKRPNANGTTNGFTTQIGAGGSGYGSGHSPQVNEQPLSTTNGWSMVGVGSAITEEYTIENAATGDVNITGVTIVDFMSWVYASSLAGETASIIVAGVTSNISLTNTNTMFIKAAGSTTYPSGNNAVGIITDTSLTTVSLYECGVLVAYTPPSLTAAQELPSYQQATATGHMIGRRWL